MSVTMDWSNEQEAVEIPVEWGKRLERLLELAARAEGIEDGEVAVTFVDDARIHELNRDYRGIDRPTDVLSFAMQEDGEDELGIVYEVEDEADELPVSEPLGDIIISVETAVRQAEEYGHSLERELGFLFVHGFLHLIGYDHQDAEAEAVMTAKQEAVLQQAGLTRE
ncbi:Metal-dependent hydrolase YbeY, involved in rRNA and/or ribosome maturation and assembly [Paenibacillus pasadenensis]|uniref:Endoribonuclease YbeY n=1 Tax=Paenibacillus pasadenensis TaxID=217090 RepID=A0A2N5N879_9BACL|nr:rRNA maturation RNase YbeY [Paenibacillus pasadenensis]PLT46535.1 Metal-dependent hydrolase YbeY, involved in rRNA and/or ribosome maturation and assembly [Paenibacillus pasadenensis]